MGNGFKRGIKSVIFFLLYYTGLEWLLARVLPVNAAAILMYHGVCDGAPIPDSINFHLERNLFERQMRILKSRYRVVELRDVVTSLARGEKLEKSVVLTFDDGYRNNCRYAAPVLDKLGLPYIVFVATSYVESPSWIPLNEIYWLWSQGELTTDEMNHLRRQVRGRPSGETEALLENMRNRRRPAVTASAEDSFAMLSWDEMKEMSHGGAEFGSHTHSHCNMAVETPEQQAAELRISKQLIETRLQRPASLFAYPYGRLEHMSESARQNVIQAGYECAVSAEYGLVTGSSDRYCLPRLGYDHHPWVFAGEILFQFAKQALRDARPKLAGGAVAQQTRERHG